MAICLSAQTGAARMRPHTALVLSGGCLRGVAQIGVLKALAAAGIRPDLVVGTSVGTAIGALYAAGRTPADIERAAHELVVARLKCWSFSCHGLWTLKGVQALVRQHLPCQRIEDFQIRFAALATDLLTGRAATFTAGDASGAVVASAAMPGFFVPAVVAGRRYADGCLVSADVLITPDLAAFDTAAPRNRQAMIDAGERAARAALLG